MMFVLGLACGGIAALPLAGIARRELVSERVRPLVAHGRGRTTSPTSPTEATRIRTRLPVVALSVGRVLSAPGVRRRRIRRDLAIGRELPVVVDLVGVAVSAGCTPYLAVEHAASYGPARIATHLRRVSRACALGQSLDDALRDLGAGVEPLRPLTEALRTSSRLGSPAAPALARLAIDARADARRRAEARARTVPVRLCFPLVACILPAFALLTVVPVVLGGLRG
jgi:tight adherence protein C